MTTEELFDKFDNEYGKFEDIPKDKRYSNRPDLHAFMMLDKLDPEPKRKEDFIAYAAHEQIFLGVADEVVQNLTEEQVLDLVRCGLYYDTEQDCITMFT